jgi:hypothetical protein
VMIRSRVSFWTGCTSAAVGVRFGAETAIGHLEVYEERR